MSKQTKKTNNVEEVEETAEAVSEQQDLDGEQDLREQAEPTAEEKLSEELRAAKDQYLRLAAEYDNFRKRSAKERENAFVDAKATVFTDLIPVLDNFDRACENSNAAADDYRKGIDMTHNQLVDVFKKFGVESFGEVNDQFDPNIHNAVMHVDDDAFDESVVVEVFQKGYRTGDRILRPAMVKVAN